MKTRRCKVLYRRAPAWNVGAGTPLVIPGAHYRDDYAGKVISVCDADHEFTAADLGGGRGLVEIELEPLDAALLADRRLKIDAEGRLLVVTADDRWGILAADLRARFGDVDAAEAEAEVELDAAKAERFGAAVRELEVTLPEMVVHSGAGLYEVGPGKTYSTIQSALDQLWADQGAAVFTANQYIRIFADTYAENVRPNTSLNPDELLGRTLIIEGDPDDDRANIIVAPSGGTLVFDIGCDHVLLRHLTTAGSHTSYAVQVLSGTNHATVVDCVITSPRGVYIYNAGLVESCNITTTLASGAGVRTVGYGNLLLRNNRITGVGKATSTTYGISTGDIYSMLGLISGNVVSGYLAAVSSAQYKGIVCENNTFYDCAVGIRQELGLLPQARIINNIFSGCDTCFYWTDQWPEETADHYAGSVEQRDNCFYGYTDFAKGPGAAVKTFAEWVALNQVDAAGDLDATDPLLTDPGAGDFSLQDGSPCLHAGHGSGVIEGQNAVEFDPSTPDIGAWSSGLVIPPPPGGQAGISAVVATESTVTVTVTTIEDWYVRARLVDAGGAEIDEQQRYGPGDIVLTPSAAGLHVVVAWPANVGGDPKGEPGAWPGPVIVPLAAGTYDVVKSVLDVMLEAFQVTNVAWENAEFTPTSGVPYLRPTFMPAEPEQAGLGDAGRNRLTGIYQVSVFAPTGKGSGEAEAKAESLVAYFKRGESFVSGDVTVRVRKAWRSAAVQEKDWFHVPVSVMWFAYTAN